MNKIQWNKLIPAANKDNIFDCCEPGVTREEEDWPVN